MRLQDRFAELDQQLASDEVRGQEPEQRQRHERDDQPGAGNIDRQIGFRPQFRRDQRLHPAVDPGDERPDQVGGDERRPDDDQSGQKIGADPRPEARMDDGRRFGRGTPAESDCRSWMRRSGLSINTVIRTRHGLFKARLTIAPLAIGILRSAEVPPGDADFPCCPNALA